MLTFLSGVVAFCTRHAWAVIAAFVVLALGCGAYAVRHFAIDTDITKLISPDLSWRQRELTVNRAFPQRSELIAAVVEAPTPELVDAAAAALANRLTPQKELFQSVRNDAGGAFFRRNGLLYQDAAELERTIGRLELGAPLIAALAADPSLRGLAGALDMALGAVQAGQVPASALAPPLDMVRSSLDDLLAGRPASFSWQALLEGGSMRPFANRRLLEIWPALDYSALQPGERASAAIRQAAQEVDRAGHYHATVRLTGSVPISDEEFATVQEGALESGLITVAAVLLILWMALRSKRMILAIFVTLPVGLAITAALGLAMVGALNLISVAFAVLFLGLGVDFAIQFSVRYRAERHACPDLRDALVSTAREAGGPLTLAAAAVAAGFFCFLPTDYKGLSELGLIAGFGMLIAYLTSVTLLPALIQVLAPRGEPEPVGFAFLAPVDRFLERYRVPVVVGTILVSLAGLPLLLNLQFDFNPMHLRNARTESISTYLDLRDDPSVPVDTAEVLAPSEAAAEAIAKRLETLPEVGGAMTLASLVPADQERKLAIIRRAAQVLGPALDAPRSPPPDDRERIAALEHAAGSLAQVAGSTDERAAAAAGGLAATLTRLAKADAATREAAETMLARPLEIDLANLREGLRAGPVTRASLPEDFVRDWIAEDGRARVAVMPKSRLDDNATLRRFAEAVLAAEPRATGEAVSILESGRTIVRAFIEAGAMALAAVAVMLWITLRRVSDVLLTLIPLVVAGAVTLEVCVLIDLKLNFANIIALPLLLGVGVAFKIYYMVAWRAGQTQLLQSSLTRAVIFSALTTATAFGSLWFSSHPGTSSMGKLLALSLACTMLAAVLFQPALMGRPREPRRQAGGGRAA